MKSIITIGESQLAVEITAYTMLIYEDRFKGKRFLKDSDELLKGGKIEDIQFSIAVKILWAAAKSADNNIEDIIIWAKKYTLADILKNTNSIVDMIVESLHSENEKKEIATAQTD